MRPLNMAALDTLVTILIIISVIFQVTFADCSFFTIRKFYRMLYNTLLLIVS